MSAAEGDYYGLDDHEDAVPGTGRDAVAGGRGGDGWTEEDHLAREQADIDELYGYEEEGNGS